MEVLNSKADLNIRTYEDLLENDLDALLMKVKESCQIRLKDRELAGIEKEDIVQEVLIKVYSSLDKYDSSKARLSTYINKIIDNMIIDCFKKIGAKKNLMLVNALHIQEYFDNSEDGKYTVHNLFVDSNAGYVELYIDIMENLNLTDLEKQVFRLRAAGYEFKEIAINMELKQSAVYSIWNRIKKKVEKIL